MKKLIGFIQKPKLALRWKLLIGFLATNLVLLGALLMALTGLFGTNQKLDAIRANYEEARTVTQIQLYQDEMVSRALDYVWSGNLARLNDFEVAASSLQTAVAAFVPDDFQEKTYTDFKQESNQLHELLKQMIALDDNQRDGEAQTLWRSQGSKLAVSASSLLDELSQQEVHQAVVSHEQAQADAVNLAWSLSILAGVGVLIAVGVALLLTIALTQPVSELQKRLTDLAKGDLTQKVDIINRDELGRLGETYNTTLHSLRQLISQLYTQSQQVTGATSELSLQAKTQVSGSSQQASAIAEATQALQELNQTAQAIARQASEATVAIEHTHKQAQLVSGVVEEMVQAQEQGRENIARTVEGLFKLKERIEVIEARQQELVEQSRVIDQVVGTIDSIARETHLLSLNASIEAAGAGEYGDRFAIIAGEVKRLADRSVMATKEVRKSLEGIAQAVERSSQSATIGLSEAELATSEARYSDRTLQTLSELSGQVKMAARVIVDYIEGTATLAINIGAATQQQQEASQQMLQTMLSIEAVTAQNLSSIRQGEVATQQLSLSALEMEHSADAFKLAA